MSHSAAPSITPTGVEAFRATVYKHYETHGRDFPWRHTTNPYHILVAEVMLQQTQTARVAPRYAAFISLFPDLTALAQASTEAVLRAWSGMGYNRRALALHATARRVCDVHGGELPVERKALLALPGIGPYSAAAIRAFAFDLPETFIETNIRTVYLHEFFPAQSGVPDSAILPLVAETMDRASPRKWYQALMDYGAMLKESGNPSRRSAHHRSQSRFEGSRRQARGIILRCLLDRRAASMPALRAAVPGWDSRFDDALETLKRDGIVTQIGDAVSITS